MVMSGCKSKRHEKSEAKLGTLLAHTTNDPGELCLLGPSQVGLPNTATMGASHHPVAPLGSTDPAGRFTVNSI